MDIYEAINKRRTVRIFKKGVPDAVLRKIILAGSKAPNPGNAQPWEFILVTDPNIKAQIAEQKYRMQIKNGATEEAAQAQRNVYQNSSVCAVCFKKGGSANIAAWLAAMNMTLATTAEGYNSVMSTINGEPREAAEKVLGLPPEYELATVMVIGEPVSVPDKPRGAATRPEFDWLHINKFGAK